jgi:hypothetical protein
MNFIWLIHYLFLALDLNTTIVEAVWLSFDQTQIEMDLLLIPLERQLSEWGYEKTNTIFGAQWDSSRFMSSPIQCQKGLSQFRCWNERYNTHAHRMFIVIVVHPLIEYVHYEDMMRNGTQLLCLNRSEWINALLRHLSRTPVGLETFSNDPLTLGRWTRTQGVWNCSE